MYKAYFTGEPDWIFDYSEKLWVADKREDDCRLEDYEQLCWTSRYGFEPYAAIIVSDDELTIPVRVHWHFQKKCFSVARYEKDKGWRLWKHTNNLSLRNAEFKVSKAGNQRVRDTGVKNVHAFVYGDLIDTDGDMQIFGDCDKIKYNPYKYDNFVNQNDTPVDSAELVTMDNGVVKAVGVCYNDSM